MAMAFRAAGRHAALALVLGNAAGQAGAAPLHVISPVVEQGEVAIETTGDVTRDRKKEKNAAQRQSYELEYSPTEFWRIEVEAKRKREPGEALKYDATEIENVFQLTEPGEYWLTVGVLAALELPRAEGDPKEIEAGLLLQKEFGLLLNTVNLIFPREIGDRSSKGVEFEYAAQSIYRFLPEFGIGLEALGELGEIKHIPPAKLQEHRIGPVIAGKFSLGSAGALIYEVGYERGLTSATANNTIRWLLEYEISF